MGIHLVFVLYELSKEIYKQVRGVYRTKLNIYDGFFFQKKLTIKFVNDFHQMFDTVLNSSLQIVYFPM